MKFLLCLFYFFIATKGFFNGNWKRPQRRLSYLMNGGKEYVYPVIRIYKKEEMMQEILVHRLDNLDEQLTSFKRKAVGSMSSIFHRSFPGDERALSSVYIPEIYSDSMLLSTLQSNPISVIYFYKSTCQSCGRLFNFFESLASFYGNVEDGTNFLRGNVDYLPEFVHDFQLHLQYGQHSSSHPASTSLSRNTTFVGSQVYRVEDKSNIIPRLSLKSSVDSCEVCHGEGTIVCPHCGGKKFVIKKDVAVICQECGGKGRARCPSCGGMCVNCLI